MTLWKTTLFSCALFASVFALDDAKMHALFLMQQGDIEGAIGKYQEAFQASGRYDFEVLHQMGLIMLQKGSQTEDPQNYLMTLFGAGISGSSGALEILEKGINHPDPQVQLLCLHFITQVDDDKVNDLLNRAMSSDFLSTRMEAAFYMAKRKHPHAVGQIEGLMFRLPPVFKPYFPSFFALLGTSEGTSALKRLMEDPDPQVRIESTLNIARLGRDDFLPMLRKRLSHSHIAEVEATIFAIGVLKDSASHQKLKKLSSSPIESIRLAASLALLQMGDRSAVPKIIELAKDHYIFAIASLGSIADTDETLFELLKAKDFQVRINAAVALLQRHNPRCSHALFDILITDSRDLAFHPSASVGRTLTAIKAIPSAEIRAKESNLDLSYSIAMREHFLREAIHLPEVTFLDIARTVFQRQQNDLVPTTIALLENLRTDGAIALLKEGAKKIAAPLVRDYCHLALYRLKEDGPYEEYINHWVTQQKTAELIRLRPLLPWKYRMEQSDYTLSAEETSRLLIDSFLSIANRRDEKSISLLLNALQKGNPQNRFALIGLLMRATE